MAIDEVELEKASLLPERWYIIMRSDDENNFYLSAYDTTEDTEEFSEYLETGEVVLNGILELVENDLERVGAAGLARIAFREEQERMAEYIEEEEGPSIEHLSDSNIVKVTFGKKQ